MTTKTDTSRLDRLEAIVESQAATQGHLQQTVDGLAHKMDKGFEALNKQIANIGKTSWPLVVAVIGMILSSTLGAVGLLMTIGVMALSPVSSKLDDHMTLPGHGKAMELHATYAERFNTIATAEAALERRIEANEAVLNTVRNDRFTGAEGDALRSRIDRLEALNEARGDAPN